MDILKQYLESLFKDIPSNDDSLKVKEDLYNMMEDKYNSLIEDGYTKNEALGKVISEFGNIEEIKELINSEKSNKEKNVKEDLFVIDTDDIITSSNNISKKDLLQLLAKLVASSVMLATSITLFITSVCMVMLMDFISDIKPQYTNILETVGICSMFGFIALGVIFILISNMFKKYNKDISIKGEELKLYNEILKKVTFTKEILVIIGVFLFIISIIPVIVLDELYPLSVAAGLGSTIMLVIISVGVWLIVAGARSVSLIRRVNKSKDGDKKEEKKHPQYKNEKVKQIMECFWPTVVCLYLIISFSLWRYWEYTWVVFPIGLVIKSIIDLNYKEER